MENAAEEPEQSESLSEIRNSADSEEATTTNSLQGKEVHHAVEDVLNEHSLHSNGEESTVAGEDTLRNVSGNEVSVSTLENKSDSGIARILEEHPDSTADGIENSSIVSSELSTDGAKEAKEPENENSEFNGAIGLGTDRNEDLPTCNEELSIASDTNEDLPTVHEEVSEENFGTNEISSLSESAQNSSAMDNGDVELPATNDVLTTEPNAADVIPSAEDDKSIEPAPADEEQTKDEAVALEMSSTTDSAASVAAEENNPFDFLSASEESRKEDTQPHELDVTPATVEETGVEDKELEPEEALPKETEVDEAQSNQDSLESAIVVEDEAPSRTKHDEADKVIEPGRADEEQVKVEGVALETPSTTKPAACDSVEEDNPFDSLLASEESRKEDTQADELDITPATVEETGVKDKDLELEEALPKETEVAEAHANEESPESDTVGDGEASSGPENDEADVGVENTEPEPGTIDAELLKDKSFTDELPSITKSAEASIEVDSAPLDRQVFTDEPPSTGKFAETTPVEDEKDVAGVELMENEGPAEKLPESFNALERDEDLEPAARPVDTMPGELALQSTEADLVEDAKTVDSEKDFELVAPTEDKEPDELGSTAESTEVTPVEDAKNDEDLDSAAPVEDQNRDELASTPESTEVTPESADESVLDEPPSTGESAEATTVEDEKDVAGVATEELTEDKGLGDKLPGTFNALEHDEDLESATTPVDTTPDELESSLEFTEADPVEDAKNVDHEEDFELAAPTEDKEPDELGSTAESTKVIPVEDAKNDEDLDSAVAIEDQNPDELASTPESTEVTPVGDASTVNHNDLEPVTPKDDTKADGLLPASDSTEDAPIEDVKNTEPVQDLLKEESIAEEHPSTGQIAETSPAMEDKGTEVPTSHEELAKEMETGEVALTSELVEGPPVEDEKASDELSSAGKSGEVILVDHGYDAERVSARDRLDKVEVLGDENPSINELPEAIPSVEDEVVDASTPLEELDNWETTDEVAQIPDSDRASLVEDGTDAEPLNGDEVVTEEDNAADEMSLISDSSDATVVEDEDLESAKDSEAPTSRAELPREVTMTDEFSRGLESGNTTSFEDSEADGLLEAEQSANEDIDSTPTLENVEASTSQELGKEESETSLAIEDKGTEVPTSHEELPKTETEEVAPPSELVGGNIVEDEKDSGGEDLNQDESVPGSIAANFAIEDKSMEFLTPSEELPKQETAEDKLAPVPQSPEINPDDCATDVELSTADELTKEEGSEEKVSTDSAEEISAAELEGGESSVLHEEDVEASASQELGKEETVDEAAQSSATSNVTPIEDAIDGEVVIEEKSEDLAGEIPLNTADAILPVDAATSDEELAKEGTTNEAAEHSESGDATLVNDLKDEEPVITDDGLNNEDTVAGETLSDTVPVVTEKDFESPTTHEELAKGEEAVLDDSVLTSESGWATSGVAGEAAEASIPHEELAKEETIDELAPAPGSGEATVVEDAGDGVPVTVEKDVNNEKYGADEAALIKDSGDAISAPENKELDAFHDFELAKEADSPEDLQRTSPLTNVDKQNNDNSKDALQPLVKEHGPTEEAIDQTFSSANDDKVEERETPLEKAPKPLVTGESVASDGDDVLERTVESADPALTADLGGATLDTQGQEAHIENSFHSLHSAVLTTSSSKAIQTRDLDPDLLQELPEKAQNAAQDSEEDTTSVPLSTQPTDLSSSWVNVSSIQEVQSASSGSQIHFSQKSHSRRPDDELTYDGDDWRIVSEQDVSALGVSKDVDTGSSGIKFPFSIVLWCSQSLFGGHKKIRND